ncbi:hypothetical protein FisN_10Lh239 [Fistulifera solaris]|uniref:Uncharacterized protein n=1 Tax=Fistulifera solaris TaxID=1519565 RepID=A0A1Z5KFH0_FISSO|nr:hypothetical protein FisN_10Lh239 [Fistulifera solaris]|eukprot:GAX25043.1 hypothetical protein FisN_10Lh239 [Fistulifera solaris]
MNFWRTVALIGWTSSSVQAIRHIQFASPLQALTIPDADVPPTPRSRYLKKIAAGLQAEQQVRDKLGEDGPIAVDISQADWAQAATANAKRQQLHKDRMLEEAFDKAVASVDAKLSKKQQSSSSTSPSQYQFVGVIQPNDASQVIQWFARPKPANSKWSVRLVHVNRDAIVHDLFRRGKIDLFGRYTNTGSKDPETGLPVVRSQYSVRERSWK